MQYDAFCKLIKKLHPLWMEAIKRILRFKPPNEYRKWKQKHHETVRSLRYRITKTSEAEVIKIFDYWENSVTLDRTGETAPESIRNMTILSVISYFQQDGEFVQTHVSYLISKISSLDMNVMRIASKILYWISRDSISYANAFIKPLEQAKAWLEDENPIRKINALFVIKSAQKLRSVFVDQIIVKYFDNLYAAATSENPEWRKYGLKCVIRHLERMNPKALTVFAKSMCEKCQISFASRECFQVYGAATVVKGLLMTSSSLVMNRFGIDDLIALMKVVKTPADKALGELIFELLSRKRLYGRYQELVDVCMSKGSEEGCTFSGLLIECVDTASDHINPGPLMDYIRKILLWTKNDECPVMLLLSTLKKYPTITDFGNLTSYHHVCKHIPKCLRLRPHWVTEKTVDVCTKLIKEAGNDDSRIMRALEINKYFPERFSLDLGEYRHVLSHRNPDVRRKALKAMAKYSHEQLIPTLILMSQIDTSKQVRFAALGLVPLTPRICCSMKLIPALYDPSSTVRKKMIEIAGKMNEYNPFEVEPILIGYLRFVLSHMMNTQDTRSASKAAAMVPTICKYWRSLVVNYQDEIFGAILDMLDDSVQVFGPDTLANVDDLLSHIVQERTHKPAQPRISRSIPASYQDISSNRSLKIIMQKKLLAPSLSFRKRKSEPQIAKLSFHVDKIKRGEYLTNTMNSKLHRLCKERDANRRDTHLVKAIAQLGPLCMRHMPKILNTFKNIFTCRSSNKLLMGAAQALGSLMVATKNGINIKTECPEMTEPIAKIIRTTDNEKLAGSFIALLGSTYDSIDFCDITSDTLTSMEKQFLLWDFNNPTIYLDTAFVALGKCFREGTIPAYATAAKIYSAEPEKAWRFIPITMSYLLRGVNTGSVRIRGTLLGYVELIICRCTTNITPVLNNIIETLMVYKDMKESIRCCSALSQSLTHEFVSGAALFYNGLLEKLHCSDIDYFKEVVRAISLMIMRQNCSFELFLIRIEQVALSKGFYAIILNALCAIVKEIDCQDKHNRLFNLMKRLELKGICVDDFFEYLCLYGNVQSPLFRMMLDKNRRAQMESVIARGTPTNDVNIRIEPMAFDDVADVTDDHVFENLVVPDELLVDAWKASFVMKTMRSSPSPAIRACSELASLSQEFAEAIFPAAFLSCWKEANEKDRKAVSALFGQILKNHSKLSPFVITLIEAADRALLPIDVDPHIITSASENHYFATYLMENMWLKNRQDLQIRRTVMRLHKRIGHRDTVSGYMKLFRDQMTEEDVAKWSRHIEDWDTALQIYKARGDNVGVAKCLRRLGRVNELIAMEDLIPKNHKTQEILMWAYSRVNDDIGVTRILTGDVIDHTTMLYLLVATCHALRTHDLDSAQRRINAAFKLFASTRSIWTQGTDQTVIDRTRAFVCLMTECSEALGYLNGTGMTKEQLINTWMQRSCGFGQDTITWDRILYVRTTVFPADEYPELYLKITSVLRKVRDFDTFKIMFSELFTSPINIPSGIVHSKLMWSAGNPEEAIHHLKVLKSVMSVDETIEALYEQKFDRMDFCIKAVLDPTTGYSSRVLNYCRQEFGVQTKDEVIDAFLKLDHNDQVDFHGKVLKLFPTVFDSLNAKVDKIVPGGLKYQLSRANRIYAGYLMSYYKDFCRVPEGIKCLSKAIEYTPNNYKAWKSWASLCSDVFLHFSTGPKPEVHRSRSHQSFDSISKSRMNHIGSLDQRRQPSRVVVFDTSVKEQTKDDCKPTLADVQESVNAFENDDLIQMAIYSIGGFLKAAELNPNNSLEYLCRVFSIMFAADRMGDSQIPGSIAAGLRHTSVSNLLLVLPLLIGLVGSNHECIRKCVSERVIEIGSQHFQKVFFPLMCCSSDYSAPLKSREVRDILNTVKTKNELLARDCGLFLDGMTRAAMTWFELWEETIKEAVKVDDATGAPSVNMALINQRLQEHDNPKCILDRLFVIQFNSNIQELKQLIRTKDTAKLVVALANFSRLLDGAIRRRSEIELSHVSEELASKSSFVMTVPGHETVKVAGFDPTLEILEAGQRPRSVYIVGANGTRYHYLLKGNADVRVDERLVHFFSLVNTVLKSNRSMKEKGALIRCYNVIPLTPAIGLVTWVENVRTITEIVQEARSMLGIDQKIEYRYCSNESVFAYDGLNYLQKLEIFDGVSELCPANEIRFINWVQSPSASSWASVTQKYTTTTAIMSVIGYIIGLGDRHPSNILIQKETGHVIHVDLGESFESTRWRTKFPEKVPFRMTRMIINALEGCIVEGSWAKTASSILRIVRNEQKALISQLAIFVHEPVGVMNSPEKALERVKEKLSGTEISSTPMAVEEQVEMLLDIAADPANYIRHYQGWCPFW